MYHIHGRERVKITNYNLPKSGVYSLQIAATICPAGAIRPRFTPHRPMKNLVSNTVLFLIPILTFAAIIHDGLTFQPASNRPSTQQSTLIK